MGGGIAAADGLSPSFPDECSHQWAQVHSRGHGTDTAGVTIRCELRHGTAHFSKENGPGLGAILRGCLSALRGGRSEEAGPLTSAASMWTIRPWGSRPDSIPFTGHRIRRWSAPFRGGSSRAMNEGTANRNRGTLHTRPLSRSNRTAFPQFSWRIRTCDHAGSRALMVTHVHDPRRGPVRSGPRATNSHISPILGRAARLQADYPDRTYGSVKPCGRLSFAWRRRSRERRHRKGQPEPRPESPAAARDSHISPILGRAARLQADYPDRTYGSVKPQVVFCMEAAQPRAAAPKGTENRGRNRRGGEPLVNRGLSCLRSVQP